MPRKSIASIRKHLHSRIQSQFVIFTLISVVMLSVVFYDVVSQGLSVLWVVAGLAVGGIIGYLVGHAFKIKWSGDIEKVIIGVDRLGVLLVIAYVVFRMLSQKLLGQFFHGEVLSVLIYSLLAGIMIGRIIGLSRKVSQVLREKKII